MNFFDWKLLEFLSTDNLKIEANKVKTLVSNHSSHIIYSIPNFDVFERPGEPRQQSNLFTDDKLNTFSINYTTDGKLYSVDLWKSNGVNPYVTYYIKDGNIEELAHYLPILQSSKIKRVDFSKTMILNESLKVTPESPKTEKSIDPDVNKAERTVEKYSDPDTIWEDLHKYMEMIISKTQPSLVIKGPPGSSKTYPVLKQLKDAGLKRNVDFFRITGKSTAAAMYVSLWEHNGKIIMYDDCDSIFDNKDGVNILKGALDSYDEREINWESNKSLKDDAGNIVPKRFLFTGNIIFITNKKHLDEAIHSRSFVLEINLSTPDMLKKMRKELPNISPNVPLSLREDAMDFIEKIAETSTKININMRTLVKAIKILRNVDDLVVAERLILQQCSQK